MSKYVHVYEVYEVHRYLQVCLCVYVSLCVHIHV